jgi:hypothetical protein
VVVEGVKEVQKAFQLPEMYENGAKTADFLHLLT